ncbi:cellulase family glycosylhydrolase [Candidatus Calescamantes bacterium]|nr:cellulase family glycosylhydrolase [Candidatus Calescamantes bacterium]
MGTIFRFFEQVYFSNSDKDDGRTDFCGGNSPLDTKQRIDYLKYYIKGMKEIYNYDLTRPVVTDEDVRKVLLSLKPKPLPTVRSEIILKDWLIKCVKYIEEESRFCSKWQAAKNTMISYRRDGGIVVRANTIDSNREWHKCFWNTSGLSGGKTYKICFNYKILATPQPTADSFFYLSIKEFRPSLREYAYIKWSGKEGNMGKKEVIFTLNPNSRYKILFGIRFKASIEIKNIKITKLKEAPVFQSWHTRKYDDSKWDPVSIPKLFQGGDALLMRKTVRINSFQKAFLKIVSLIENAQIWINGFLICQHWGREPFEIDLSDKLIPCTDNLIAIKIDKREPSFGIGGNISLVLTSNIFINNVLVNTINLNEKKARVLLEIDIKNEQNNSFNGVLEIKLYPWFPEENKRVVINKNYKVQIEPKSSLKLKKFISVLEPYPWSPEKPCLYLAKATLKDRFHKEIDDYVTSFGLRKISLLKKAIYINNRKVFLKGASEMAVWAPINKVYLQAEVPSDENIIRDILLIKKMNGNLLRWHPGIASGIDGYVTRGFPTNYERIVELADQLGIYLMTGVGFWLWQSDHTRDGEYKHWFDKHVSPSIEVFKNSPSIIIWEGGNENCQHGSSKELVEFCDYVSHKITSVDNTRLIVPSSGWSHKLSLAEIKKIIRGHPKRFCLSTHFYPGWYSEWSEIWSEDTKQWLPMQQLDIPFLLGEYGAEAMPCWDLYPNEPWNKIWKHWDGSSLSILDKLRIGRPLQLKEWIISQAYQALVLQNIVSRVRLSKGSGAIVCTLADSQRDDGSYHKGICDLYRRPKLGFYTLKMCYQDIFIQSTNGDIVFGPNDKLYPNIVNEGKERSIKLGIVIKDIHGIVVHRETRQLRLKKGSLAKVKAISPKFPKTGIYWIYYKVEEIFKNG